MNTPQGEIWGMVLAILRKSLKPLEFEFWLDQTTQISFSDEQGELVVGVSSQFNGDMINNRFGKKICATFAQIQQEHGIPIKCVSFRVSQKLTEEAIRRSEEIAPPAPSVQTHINLGDPVAESSDQSYTEYVMHPGNERALGFVKAVTQARPCALANVVFMWGDPGSGKTALAQCALKDFKERYSRQKRFVTRFVRMNDWYDRYQTKFRGMDKTQPAPKPIRAAKTGLLVPPYDRSEYFGHAVVFDDCNALEGNKASSHGAWFGILKAMMEKGPHRGQVFVTASCPPDQIKGFPPALISLLSSGLVLKVDRPDLNSSLRILRSRISEFSNLKKVEPDALELIARSVNGDVRAMIGVLIQLNLSIQREARELQMDLFGEPPSPIVANTLTVTAVRGELMARGIQPWEPAIVEPRSRITPLPKEQPITAIGSIITDLGILAKTKKLDAKRVVSEVEKHLRLTQLLDDGQITPERIYGRQLAAYICRAILNMEEIPTAKALRTNALAVFTGTINTKRRLEQEEAKALGDLTAIQNALLGES